MLREFSTHFRVVQNQFCSLSNRSAKECNTQFLSIASGHVKPALITLANRTLRALCNEISPQGIFEILGCRPLHAWQTNYWSYYFALFNCKLVESRVLRDRCGNIFDDSIVSLPLNNSKTIRSWDLVLGGPVFRDFSVLWVKELL